jgi:inositol oxygenase
MNSNYRNYDIASANTIEEKQKLETIHKTYRLQRTNITYDFNQYLINKYCTFKNRSNFWSLFSLLDNITDLSDPDTSLPNSIHALQTAEAIRNDPYTHVDWMPLVGLIHDMGKILYVNGCDADGTSKTTQWSIVGDTYITGAPIPSSIVLPELNNYNKDHQTGLSKYHSGCGIENTSVSFGHDEYMYRLLKANNHKMPKSAEYIVRYHSLYAWHSETGYNYLENHEDREMKKIVKEFNKFDLYTKNDELPIKWTHDLRDFYSKLIKKYLAPDLVIKW